MYNKTPRRASYWQQVQASWECQTPTNYLLSLRFYTLDAFQYSRCKAKALSLYIDKTHKFLTIEVYLEKD